MEGSGRMVKTTKRTPASSKRSGPATLKDVAERAGVHISTVSRVLNSSQRRMVSDDVAERVRTIATEMGYRVNPFGYGLRTKKSRAIGVVIPDLTNPVFPPMIRGMEHALREVGYTAIFADSNESVETERKIVEQMQMRQVEGLVLASAHRADKIVEDAINQGLPVVLINRTSEHADIISVTNDDFAGSMMAVEHLIELGHRNIAHLAGPRHLSTGNNRRKGYLAAMKKHGLVSNQKLVVTCPAFGINDGAKGFNKLIDKELPFTAIFAGNDAIALGCYKAIAELGLSCPKDISIIGYNDMPLVDMVHPRLSTVRFNLYEMGASAANALVQLIEEDTDIVQPSVLEPKLVVRDSTARLQQKKAR